MVSFRMASWIQRSLGLRPRFKRIRRRKIAGLNRGALSAQVVRLEERVLPAATTNLADMNGDTDQQNASSNAREFTTIGTKTFFTYNSQVTNKPLLAYKDTNFPSAQPVILPDQTTFRFSPNTQISELTAFNGKLYFVATDGNPGMGLGKELWSLDPATNTFACITDYDGTHATNVNGVANGAINGKQMVTDGSANNFVKNEGSAPSNLTISGGKLYFTATDKPDGLGANRELYYTDGTLVQQVKTRRAGIDEDINPTPNFLQGSSTPLQLKDAGGILYFTAVDAVGNGRELWRTDGTATGTFSVGNIRPGSQDSGITELTAGAGNVIYFSANDGTTGYELWQSDGSPALPNGAPDPAHTFRVKDIQPVLAGVNQGSNPSSLLFANGVLYFAADDGIVGKELWKSDGTAAGTVIVKDIAQTGPGGVFDVKQNSNPHNLTKVVNGGNTYIYFSANDGKEGFELWKTDGTAAGTFLVHTASDPNSADPAHLFAGINRGKTSSGDATAGSYPGSLLDVSGELYFIATDIYTTNGQTNFELYKVDPAGSGVIQQVGGQINTVVNEWQSQFDIADPQQDFTYAKASADSFHPTEVIQDKSPTGFRTDASNRQLFAGPVGSNLIYFTADNGANGSTSRFYGDHAALNGQTTGTLGPYNPNFEPWSFNTATSTASIVQDMNQQSLASLDPFGFTTVTVTLGRDPITFSSIQETRTFFFFTDLRSTAKPYGLAYTDSSGKTTDTGLRFDSIGTAERPNPVVFGNNSILFIANGKEVWRTNGQMTGTECVATADISIDLLTVSGSRYYYYGVNWSFVNGGQQQNGELWSGRTGIQAAELVQEIAPIFQNLQHSAGIKFIVPRQAGGIWFNANDFGATNNGSRDVLWVSNPDDNAVGTRIVVSAAAIGATNPTGPQGPRNPYTAGSSGNTVYFAAGTTLYRSQIFFNNGAYDGAAVDQFTAPISGPLGTISDVTPVTGGVYFVVNGSDLYFSDGTPAGGSVLVGSFTSLSELKATGNRLYFVDTQFTSQSTVYTSTAAALPAVAVNSANTLFNVNNLVITGNRLYFSAFSGGGGQELWVSQNQLEPTQVTDIRPGNASSLNLGSDIHSHVAVGNGRVFFGANDASFNELANSVQVGGSTVDTLPNKVIHPTTASSQARDFIVYDEDGFGGSFQPSVYFFSDVGPNRSVLTQLSTDPSDPSADLFLSNIDVYRDWGGSPGGAVFFDDYSAVEVQSEVAPFPYEHFGEYGHPQSDFGIYKSGKTALATRTNGGYLGQQFLFFSGFNGENTGGNTPFMFGQELYVLYQGQPVRITDLRVASNTLQGNANPGYLTSIGNDADGESTFVLFAAAPSGTSSGALYKVTVPATGIPTSWPVAQISNVLNPRYLQSLGGGQTTGGRIYFTAGPENNRTAWVTDGNTATQLSTAIVDESAGDGHIFGFSNGKVYFSAREPGSGSDNFELYQTDHGTGATIQLKDINQTIGALGQAGSRPGNFTDVNGTLYFAANDGIHGFELWQTNGTAAGTQMVKASDANGNIVDEINPGPAGSNPGVVITTKTDTDLNGVSTTHFVYTYEGFAVGNTRPDEFGVPNAGINSPNAINPAKHNSGDNNGTPTLMFAATNSQYGRELWQVTPNNFSTTIYSATDASKGTTTLVEGVTYDAGTSTVTFVFNGALQTIPGVTQAQIAQGVPFISGGVTYTFKSTVYNGHKNFAELVKDIAPGSRSSNPKNLTTTDGTVWMSADDGLSGDTLWNSIGLDQLTGNMLTIKLIDDASLFAANSPLVNGIRNPDDFTFLSTDQNSISRLVFTAGNDLGKTEVYTLRINHTPTQLNMTSVAVPENQPQGTLVGTLGTTDPDFGDSFQYKFVVGAGDTDNDKFQIVGTSLQIKQPLDFETKSTYTVRLRTTDQRGQFYEKSFTVNVSDVNEAPIGMNLSGLTTTIVENTVIPAYNSVTHVGGINLGTIIPIDIDAPASATNAFRVDPTSTDAASFDIFKDPVLGWQLVYVGSSPNFEVKTSYAIGILLDDPTVGGDPDVGPVTFTLNVIDVDEYQIDTIVDDDPSPNQVAENSAIGAPVGITVRAYDSGAPVTVLGQIDGSEVLTYSLTNDAGGLFKIVKTIVGGLQVGVVQVANPIDREPANASYNITVQVASSDGTVLTQNYTINIIDVDEFKIDAIRDTDAAANSVLENSVGGTTVGITAHAVDSTPAPDNDPDATETITYSLTNDASGRFTINSSTGVVTVATGAVLDREQAASYTITVQASSSDGSVTSQDFVINLIDVDEFHIDAIRDSNAAVNQVLENSLGGTTVGITAHAVQAVPPPDAEPDATEVITYSLTNNAGGRFLIDPSTGVVTVATGAVLDREQAASYTITVRSVSSDGSTASQDFVINLIDVDEYHINAIRDVNAAADQVAENAATGTATGITAHAFQFTPPSQQDDPDATEVITYTLTNSAGGRFQIDPSTGIVTVLDGTLIDREQAASYTITVRADSSDGLFVTQDFVINVVDVDEFHINDIKDVDPTITGVAENSVGGTTVGFTAHAFQFTPPSQEIDPDATEVITYALTSDASGRFDIDPSTGVVTVQPGAVLDRELNASFTITVQATSNDGSVATKDFVIPIFDVDEFDISPITDADPAANQILEFDVRGGGALTNGTPVGFTASAFDADATTNVITYSLLSDAGGRFQIDPVTGVITVKDAASISREAAASWQVLVQAASQDGSTSQLNVVINILDVDEYDAVGIFDSDVSANAVPENSPIGTPVGITAVAFDSDATTNGITYSLFSDAGGRFAINPVTGVITVANSALLDREAAAAWHVLVQATSQDGSKVFTDFGINLIDVDEFDVGPVFDTNNATDAVNENSVAGTAVGLTAKAVDLDPTAVITYSLLDNAGGRFQINSSTGVVTVLNGALLNREAAASHKITVRASSTDGSTSQKDFTIAVNDVDEFDVTAIGNVGSGNLNVNEHSSIGTAVGVTAFASDADATNNTITYSLDDNSSGRFAINPITGVVTIANSALFDREVAAFFDFTVRATSADGSFSTATFRINVIEVNDNQVTNIIDTNATSDGGTINGVEVKGNVNEKAATGTVVGITAFATDADVGANGQITYSLQDTSGGRYKIDPLTGVVTVDDGTRIDFEANTSNIIVVKATAGDGSFKTKAFAITVNDVAEAPEIVLSNQSVNENLASGAVVGVFSVQNATPTSPVYALISGTGSTNNGSFQIVGNQLRTKAKFNFEAKSSYSIRVRVTSSNGVTSQKVFIITVNNVNEAPTGISLSKSSVKKTAPVGTAIGLFTATDPDAGNTFTYTLVAGTGSTDNAKFLIVGNELRVNAPLGTGTSAKIRVRVTDQNGLSFEKTFTISLTR